MPHVAIWKPDGVHKKLSGFITAIEFIRAATEVLSDPRFDDARYVIKDLSEVTEHEITAVTLADLAVIHSGFQWINPNCRIVFITTEKYLIKLIKRILLSPRLAPYPVEILPTLVEAGDWLACQPKLQRTSRVKRTRF